MLTTVALLLHFAAANSEYLVVEMQPELEAVFARSPVSVRVQLDSYAGNLGTPDHVVYVNIRQSCGANLIRFSGSLASVQNVDGIIQPLIEIDCARVAAYIHAPSGLARALARVVAHELLHYLLQEPGHARDGIFRASLAPHELTDVAPPALRVGALEQAKLLRTY